MKALLAPAALSAEERVDRGYAAAVSSFMGKRSFFVRDPLFQPRIGRSSRCTRPRLSMRWFFRTLADDTTEESLFTASRHLGRLLAVMAEVPLEAPGTPLPMRNVARRHGTYEHVLEPGALLVAHPLSETFWERSVLLVTSHDSRRSEAVILNKPLLEEEKEELFELDGLDSESRTKLRQQECWYGGVCSGLSAVRRHANRGTPLGDGLSVGSGSDGADRVLMGHVEWSANQLQDELRQGYWFLVPKGVNVGASLPSDADEALEFWRRAMSSVGKRACTMSRIPRGAVERILEETEYEEEKGTDDANPWITVTVE